MKQQLRLFAKQYNGLQDKIAELAFFDEVENSVFVSRAEEIQTNIDSNTQRIIALSAALEKEREFLLETFPRLEETISKLQNNLSAIGQIQSITPLTA